MTEITQLTTTQVGAKLEREFGKFMKAELGYKKVEYNVPMNGKVSERFYDCDLHAVKGGEAYDTIMKIGFLSCGLLAISLIFNIPAIEETMKEILVAINPSLASYTFFIFGVGGIAIGLYGKKNQTTHAWVECKEHGTKVKRAHIVKLKEAVADVKKVDDPKWTPSVVIMVSRSGFDADAINFAREFNIELYQRSGNSFEYVD